MAITNEQAMRELLAWKRKPESASELCCQYDAGVFYGQVAAYWRADVITFEQYRQLTDMPEAQVQA